MGWVWLDDQYPEHPKLLGLGAWCEVAGWLHLAAVAWSNRYLTDGQVPKAAVWRLAAFRDVVIEGEAVTPEAVATRLVGAGLWEDRGADYRVHDYLEYQPSKEAVLARRAADRERKQGVVRSADFPRGFQTDSARNRNGSGAPTPTPSIKDPDPDARARAGREPEGRARAGDQDQDQDEDKAKKPPRRVELPPPADVPRRAGTGASVDTAGPDVRGGDPVRLGALFREARLNAALRRVTPAAGSARVRLSDACDHSTTPAGSASSPGVAERVRAPP